MAVCTVPPRFGQGVNEKVPRGARKGRTTNSTLAAEQAQTGTTGVVGEFPTDSQLATKQRQALATKVTRSRSGFPGEICLYSQTHLIFERMKTHLQAVFWNLCCGRALGQTP